MRETQLPDVPAANERHWREKYKAWGYDAAKLEARVAELKAAEARDAAEGKPPIPAVWELPAAQVQELRYHLQYSSWANDEGETVCGGPDSLPEECEFIVRALMLAPCAEEDRSVAIGTYLSNMRYELDRLEDRLFEWWQEFEGDQQ